MTPVDTASAVTSVPALDPDAAHAYFAGRLAVECDAADVAAAVEDGARDFILVDARSPEEYAAAHLPGAVNIPHRTITRELVDELPDGLIVTYCWGPGCNAATHAAAKFTALGRAVKEMIGGFEYWVREGSPVEGDAVEDGRYAMDPSGLVVLPPAASCGC